MDRYGRTMLCEILKSGIRQLLFMICHQTCNEISQLCDMNFIAVQLNKFLFLPLHFRFQFNILWDVTNSTPEWKR